MLSKMQEFRVLNATLPLIAQSTATIGCFTSPLLHHSAMDN